MSVLSLGSTRRNLLEAVIVVANKVLLVAPLDKFRLFEDSRLIPACHEESLIRSPVWSVCIYKPLVGRHFNSKIREAAMKHLADWISDTLRFSLFHVIAFGLQAMSESGISRGVFLAAR